MKRVTAGLIVFLVLTLSGFGWWKWATAPVNPDDKEVVAFTIEKGEPVREIAKRLRIERLVRDPIAFFLVVKRLGIEEEIQAGRYNLDRSKNTYELAWALTSGSFDIRVTIPEGWRSEEILTYLKNQPFDNKEKWTLPLTAWEESEGYLFPDTYFFSPQMAPEEVRERFGENFDKRVRVGLVEEFRNSQMSLDEILILASLVEREVKTESDRPVVSGILLKRLKSEWSLDVDASVQYAVATVDCREGRERGEEAVEKCDWWPEVRGEDLEIDSPYNTYRYKGLPPTPIANPGLASIKAVLNPVETDYWYYLSDSSGKIHYARTLEEQNANIERYLR